MQLKVNPDNVTGVMLKDGNSFRPVDERTWSVEARIRDMDRTKVSKQVLSTVPVMFSYWAKDKDALFLHRYLNDHLNCVVKSNPDRFLGLGTVPMQNPVIAVEEVKR